MADRTLTIKGVGVARGDAVVSMTPSWDTTGAPQLTVVLSDRDRRLQDSALLFGGTPGAKTPLGDLIAAEYAGTQWVATALEPGRTPTVTLEHYIASDRRGRTGPYSSAGTQSPGKVAKALLTLGSKGRWRVVCPEADGQKPPILDAKTVSQQADQQAQRDEQRAPGFPDSASFRIGWPAPGRVANREQKRVLATAMSVADELAAGPLARLALVLALSVESAARRLSYGDSSSTGPLQLLVETARGLGISANDVEAICRIFLKDGFAKYAPKGAIELERAHPDWTAGRIAQTCQGSKFPDRYDSVAPQGRIIVKAWSGSTSTLDASSGGKQSFQIDDGTTFWDASGTLASERNRRRFIGQNGSSEAVYWLAESVLAKARPYVTATPYDLGTILTPGTIDELRNIEKLSCQLQLPWDQAGQVIGRNITVADYGVYNGTYLAVKASAGKDGRWVNVDLEKPRNPLKKAISTATVTGTVAAGAGSRTSMTATSAVPKKVQRVKNWIDSYTARKTLYLWGGGHGGFAGPYDCSGFGSAVGHVAGIVSTPMATGAFSTWGLAGEGEWLTFWVHETGVDDQSHMYVTVKQPGGLRVAEAGGIRGAYTGWRGPESPARRAGFEPRHAQGW